MRFFHNLMWSTRGSDYENSATFFSRDFFSVDQVLNHPNVTILRQLFGALLDLGFVSQSFSDKTNTDYQPKKTVYVKGECVYIYFTVYKRNAHTNQKEESTTTTIKPSNDLKTFIELSTHFVCSLRILLHPTISPFHHHNVSPLWFRQVSCH